MFEDESFGVVLNMGPFYHLTVCEEKSIIDMSNHVVIVGRKN